MINTFLESKNLLFEPLEEKHLSEEYISWLNSKEITQYNSHGIYPNTAYLTKEYITSVQKSKSTIVLAIIEKETLKHIGNCSISKIDFINSNGDLSILIGDKNSWGKGYATETFEQLINHSFHKLNLHKITAGTTSDNIAMQKVCTKLGMLQESVYKEHIRRDGNFYDIYTYALINKA